MKRSGFRRLTLEEVKAKQAEQREKAKLKPKKRRPPKTLAQKTAQQLVEPADNAWSKYIRLRDSVFNGTEWVGTCITCPRQLTVIDAHGKWIASSQCGHFITRGVYSLRFDELNTNLQCAHCNVWRDKEAMLEAYRQALDLKYGEGTYKELKRLSALPGAYKRPPKPTLLQIIKESKEQVAKWLESNPSLV